MFWVKQNKISTLAYSVKKVGSGTSSSRKQGINTHHPLNNKQKIVMKPATIPQNAWFENKRIKYLFFANY